jgi:hypothetical protein
MDRLYRRGPSSSFEVFLLLNRFIAKYSFYPGTGRGTPLPVPWKLMKADTDET